MTVPILHAIGTAVPQHRIAQQDYEKILLDAEPDRAQKLRLRRIYGASGIAHRHSVLAEYGQPDHEHHVLFQPGEGKAQAALSVRMELFEEHALPLLREAALDAFAQMEECRPEDVTHVITFSCTGLYAPGTDIELINALGMAKDAERTCINFMGCYAAINAMKTAAHICRSEPEAVVLLAGVELCTLHYRTAPDTDQMVANAIFADGAATGIVSAKSLRRKGNAPALALSHFYAAFEDAGAADMVWRVRDHGFELRLSADVPGRLEVSIRGLVEKLLAKTGKSMPDIDRYAIHPGGVRILQACEKALELTPEDNACSYEVLRNNGNMSSVTVLFVLRQQLQSRPPTGSLIMTCAFGPGLTMESALVEVV